MNDVELGEFARHFVEMLDAKDHAANGEYCRCVEPNVLGTMCRNCKRLDRSIEIEQVLRIVRAHDFEPDQQHPEFCHICVTLPDHPRHNGVDGHGRLRDGTPVDPSSYPKANDGVLP